MEIREIVRNLVNITTAHGDKQIIFTTVLSCPVFNFLKRMEDMTRCAKCLNLLCKIL